MDISPDVSTNRIPPSASELQALVCSQIVNVLPYNTFRRQYFEAWTVCSCVSPMRATCSKEKVFRPAAPEPSQAEAEKNPVTSAPEYRELLRAFSVQQTCFLSVLRGRSCAFSWEKGGRPACDCAQKVDLETGEQIIVETNAEKKKSAGKGDLILVEIPDSAYFQDESKEESKGSEKPDLYSSQWREERGPKVAESTHLRTQA